MNLADEVLSLVLKEVELPDYLIKYFYLILEREQKNKYSCFYRPERITSDHITLYAHYLVHLVKDIAPHITDDGFNVLLKMAPEFLGVKHEPYKPPFNIIFVPSSLQADEIEVTVHIPRKFRREHSYILGSTGSGKTQLIQQLIAYDLTTNASIVVMDSQGDLINTLLRSPLIEPERLVIVDPVDSVKYPLALNMFHLKQYDDPVERERQLNGVTELLNFVFSSVMDSALTDKQSVLFNFCIRLMLATPHATLYTFVDLLEHGVDDFNTSSLPPIAQKFFRDSYGARDFSTTRQEVLRRLYSLLENPTISRIFQSPENKLDIGREMDNGKVILISTDRSLLKRSGCAFFGRFFLSLISQAMQDRANRPPQHRRKTYVYVDECGDYLQTNDSNITDILEKGRKYNVGLTLAHQELSQLPQEVFHSIKTNTSVKLIGHCSASDARALKDDMNCDALNYTRKLMFFLKTPSLYQPMLINVPVGVLESLKQRTDEDVEAIMVANRQKYCVGSYTPPQTLQNAPEQAKSDKPSTEPYDPFSSLT